MIITYYGLSCFKIQSKPSEGVSVIVDPFNDSTGLSVPKTDTNLIILNSNIKYITGKNITGSTFTIDSAGEYDVKNIAVKGINIKGSKQVIYRIAIDNISVVHLGELNRILSTEELEEINGTDILIVPIGGKTMLDAAKAREVIGQIEPRIVIPMLYNLPDLKIELDGLEKFIKEMGIEPTNEEKLRINKRDDLPSEDMELVILGTK
ncbi:MAG: MBL fold metallo-hydrolase [Candidatus Falkowbacteria bacterium]|nr:MBL fold metallo-hydrolase [Candidatus Falkowbacteria bacterium]